MNENRQDPSVEIPDRIDYFRSDGDSLVIYDREAIDAWIQSDCWVFLQDASDESDDARA